MEIKKLMGQLMLPRMDEEMEMRLNLLCATVRQKLTSEQMSDLNRSRNTVFGEFGVEGEYVIPDVDLFMELRPVLPGYRLIKKLANIRAFELRMSQYTEPGAAGLPAGCPCKQLPFRFATCPGSHGTALVWDGITVDEDPTAAAMWLAKVLKLCGTKFVAGKMAYIESGTRHIITVGKGGEIVAKGSGGRTLREGKDFTFFYPDLSPKPTDWAVLYDAEIIRNAERFTGSNVNDPDAVYDDGLWDLEEGMSGYAGTVSAFSEAEALKTAAKVFSTKQQYLTVMKLA